MKNRIYLVMFLLSAVLPVWAQIGGDYNPDSPSDPGTPVLKHQLTIRAVPEDGGSFNLTDRRIAVGSSTSLSAYTSTDFVFKQWMIGDSVVSESQNMKFVMPNHDVELVGQFEYNPANPANPSSNYWNKETGEVIVDDFTTGSLSRAISTAISGSNSSAVQMITVAGKINSNDFGIINSYKNCGLLDLSRVTGVSEVPSYAFDYTNLETVYLPATIEKIGSRAFEGCSRLSSLIVYAMTPPALGNYVFQSIPEGMIVYVPAAAIPLYKDEAGWSDFTILPIQEDIRNISVSLPKGVNAADYAQMWLELTNTKNGQRMHYVLTDRTSYTFNNIIRNTSWKVTLRNERGDVFGQIDGVEVKDDDVSVTFASLARPQNVTLKVLAPDGSDVTAQTQVTWTDVLGNYIAQSTTLAGLPAGYQAAYRIVLSQDLAMMYSTPLPAEYVLVDGSNDITCQLSAIPQVKITGKVKDVSNGLPLDGTTVSASQTFGGKYGKTISTKTDRNGEFMLEVPNVPTSVAFAASDYISQTVKCDSLLTGNGTVTLADILLKAITGATITLDFTYTTCEGERQNWYSDYNNVSYELYNETKQCAVSQYNVQYPQIVLLEEIDDNDVLRLTATSRTNVFMPVVTKVTVAEQKASATFQIKELGKIQSSFATTGNTKVVGSLYDSNGKLIKTYDYSNTVLTIPDLADGQYTLITMGSSRLFNTIYDIAQLPQTGLVAGTDYVQNSVEVESGAVSVVSIEDVPALDETKLYYTGDNTSFAVNKPSIVAGNYLTLTGHIDFKPAYAASVRNVQMIVDLPESCEFVENSVMVGNATSSYTVNGHQIAIPMELYTDRVRFCVVPTRSGEYTPSAFTQFDLNGKTVTQPIGSASYTAKGLSIVVPSIVAKASVPVSGTAVGKCDIEIYDNDVMIGQTTSLANGTWTTTCELNEPYNLSRHDIYAKVVTANNVLLQSDVHKCIYDKNAIEPQTVTMSYYNYATGKNVELVFDFKTKQTSANSYLFYTTDFTFVTDFTNNDSALISDVSLFVFTSGGEVRKLRPVYNGNKDRWVANDTFDMYNLPVNVSLDYYTKTELELDTIHIAQVADEYYDVNDVPEADSIMEDVKHLLGSGIIDYTIVDEKLSKLDSLLNDERTEFVLTDLENKYLDSLSTAKSENDFFLVWNNYVVYVTPPYCPGTNNITLEEWLSPTDRPKQENIVFELEVGNPSLPKIEYIKNTNNNAPFQGAKWRPYISETGEFDTSNNPGSNALQSGDWLNESTGDIIKVHWGESVQQPDNTIEAFREFGNQLCETISQFGNPVGMSLETTEAWIGEVNKYYAHENRLLSNLCKRTQKLPGQERALKVMYERRLKNYNNRLNARRWKQRIKILGRFAGGIGTAVQTRNSLNDSYKSYNSWEKLIGDLYKLCKNDEADKFAKMARDFQGQDRRRNVGIGIANGALAVVGAAGVIGAPETLGTSLLFTLGAGVAGCGVDYIDNQFKDRNEKNMKMMLDLIRESPKCTPTDDDSYPKPPFSPVSPNIDPSGYVYEAVANNRLEGVTATVFYKENVEDMYGDLHESIVKWEATEYAQENPLFTDENGMYRWDVPQGLWQVKFEKEGYETTYSEWLPVPPPQLEVNIGMKQNRQPEVKNVRAYEDAVEVEFDKYMMPELLTTENVAVLQNGTPVEGEIELLNEERSMEGSDDVSYASKIRFNSAKPFTEREVTLVVNNRVKSYAGIRMQDNYQQTFRIEQEIKNIVNDSLITINYGEAAAMVVSVLPASASSGKTLKIKTSSQMIVDLETEQVVIGKDGTAEILLTGELPGTAALTFSIEGTDKTATTIVNVERVSYTTVATPTASITSGSVVEKGTKITLSCKTEGATIYYTLDGTCPCDDTESRKVYDGTPIVVNKDITIKAMATAPELDDSDIAEFKYRVSGSDGIKDVTLNGQIEIWPLPVREELNVTAGGKMIKRVSVTTSNGVQVILENRASKRIVLDTRMLVAGLYIINIVTDGGECSRKIIKIE